MVRVVVGSLLGLTLACSNATQFDGAPSLATVQQHFTVVDPAPPAPPEGPRLTTCPAGWGSDPLHCEPWPAGPRTLCTGSQAQFPGDPACAEVGPACPADGWPASLPTGTVRFVRGTAAVGGDGTRARPFQTIAEALAAGGGLIALGTGTYALPGPLPAGVSLVGTCVAQTTLVRAATSQPAVVFAETPGISVRDLRVLGPGVGLAVTDPGSTLSVENVVVEGATSVGWLIQNGGQATARALVIRGTATGAGGTLGSGIQLSDASGLDLTRALIEGSHTAGVFLAGAGAHATMTGVAIVDTQATSRSNGHGLWANGRTRVTLSKSIVEGNQSTGLYALSGAALDLTDVLVRGTRATPGANGDGVYVAVASAVTAQRLWLGANAGLGLGVSDADSTVTVSDFVSERNAGLGANTGGLLFLDRGELLDCIGSAVTARGVGARVTAHDLTIRRTHLAPGQLTASGLSISRGAFLSAQRVLLDHCEGLGAAAVSAGSELVASDLEVRDTQRGADGEGGWGVVAALYSQVTLERARLDHNVTSGVIVGQARATLTDVEVFATQGLPSQGGLYGYGVTVEMAGAVTGTRLRLIDNHDVGLLVADAASAVDFSEMSILRTSLTCADTACMGRAASGVTVLEGGQASVSRFWVASNGGFGVQVARGGQLDLAQGEVAFHQIGVGVLDEAFDLSRLDHQVVYRNNDQKLSALVVPLPKVPPLPAFP